MTHRPVATGRVLTLWAVMKAKSASCHLRLRPKIWSKGCLWHFRSQEVSDAQSLLERETQAVHTAYWINTGKIPQHHVFHKHISNTLILLRMQDPDSFVPFKRHAKSVTTSQHIELLVKRRSQRHQDVWKFLTTTLAKRNHADEGTRISPSHSYKQWFYTKSISVKSVNPIKL